MAQVERSDGDQAAPGSIVLVVASNPMSVEAMHRLRKSVVTQLGDSSVPVVVVESGVDLRIVR